MRKIAASLNEQNEQDAFILAFLPDDNVSSVIKDALQLYYQVEKGQLTITLPGEEVVESKASGGGLDAEVVATLLMTMERIANGVEAQTRELKNLRVVGAVAAENAVDDATALQEDDVEPIEDEEERLDPNDPMVRNLMGITEKFAKLEFGLEQ